MKGIIEWFARNPVAANLLMAGVIIVGLMTMTTLKREVVPEVIVESAMIQVVYPGAAPEEVEEGICMRIEKEVQGLAGVDQVKSTAFEGMGMVTVDFLDGEDRESMLDDIKSAIDRIDNFPADAEEPQVELVEINNRVMTLAIWGDASPADLREAGRRVEDALIAQPEISLVKLSNAPEFEISIEVGEAALRRHGLSFDEVVGAVRMGSLDLPGGGIKTDGGEILLRAKGQGYVGADFAGLVVRATPDGGRVLLGDVAEIRDEFAETDQANYFNGEPAVLLDIYRVGKQDALGMVEFVDLALETARTRLPEGLEITRTGDDTKILKERLDLLIRNGRAGLLLVLVALALFLRLRLALWVTIGIPVAMLGAVALMPAMEVSINLISLFGFIVVLGIVVDDAIVVAENIHEHRQRGKSGLQAAVEGAGEMIKPVTFAILTTIAAFVPMMLMPGNMGQYSRNIPLVAIGALIFSLVEAFLVMPAHLRHLPADSHSQSKRLWARLQSGVDSGLRWVIKRVYQPSIVFFTRWRYLTVATGIAVFLAILGYAESGRIRFNFFPAIEADNVVAKLQMPLGTPLETTEAGIRSFEAAAQELMTELKNEEGKPLILNITTAVGAQPYTEKQQNSGGTAEVSVGGSHLGEVNLELLSAEEREMSGTEILRVWRERTGPIPGAEEVSFSSDLMGGGGDVNIQLSGADMDSLQSAADELRERLLLVKGVTSARDTFVEGKREIKLSLNEEGEALGLRLADLGRQVRQAFYGEKAQSIQRGRDEVDVMVRYPREDRERLATLDTMRLRTADGREVPFAQVAEAEFGRGYSKIDRLDRRRSVSVLADLDKLVTTPDTVLATLRDEGFLEDLAGSYPGMQFSLEGKQREQSEFMAKMMRMNGLALVAIFILLAIPLRSYTQPLIIMSAIPFGFIGAVLGHIYLDLDLTIFSLIGIVALSGIVVNDSLVMMDVINRERDAGVPLRQVVVDAGTRRFRAIMLTTVTTFLGLTPLLLEKSLQARFLIPMAVSVAFGVVFATLITLVLVPSLYLILEDFHRLRENLGRRFSGFLRTARS
jgi:multidrug efflux pump subunit AcrB